MDATSQHVEAEDTNLHILEPHQFCNRCLRVGYIIALSSNFALRKKQNLNNCRTSGISGALILERIPLKGVLPTLALQTGKTSLTFFTF